VKMSILIKESVPVGLALVAAAHASLAAYPKFQQTPEVQQWLSGPFGQELEDGVGAQGVVVILVLVVGQDAVDAAAHHLQEGMLREAGGAGVVEGGGEGLGESDAVVELADGQQTGVTGKLARRGLDHERRAEEVEDLGPPGWYTPSMPPRWRIDLPRQQLRRIHRAMVPDPARVVTEVVLLRPSSLRSRPCTMSPAS
jgi:hypothetical protein